ncbi:MAG TPA: PQQ-dependent sugar dehydrogenase, partial [Pirellulales bacterium]
MKIWPKLSLTRPIYLIRQPGTQSMLLIEQVSGREKGRIRRVEVAPDVATAETILELDRLIYALAFHPDFGKNGYVFVVSNRKGDGKARVVCVSRFTMQQTAPFRLFSDSERVILEWPSNGHDGGDLGFGPDGFLYFPTGDGTSDSDGDLTGQSMNDLLGAMLRIDVDHPADGKPYSIPRHNPFVDLAGARPEIWAYGFRNPWRMTFDSRSGQLWVGNNGQDLWEQVFLVRRGDNFGWSVFEGDHPFQPQRRLGPTPHVPPAAEHPHSEARSLTGGVVYYAAELPELQGTYIYGDYSTGRIWGLRHDGHRATYHRELADTPLAITGFAIGPDGNLLVIDHGGGIYQLVPNTAQTRPETFPARLSETGLFRSAADDRPDPALIPYSVNAPLWSDGASKDRWIALPGKSQIDFTAKHGWNFPEGAVLVKTFSLELDAGKTASRRRVETRLLTRQQGEWQGYSYQWNEEQTDAMLVASAGSDRSFTIHDSLAPGGRREQIWRYPSRAECMVCHSRAVNFVLGLNTWQMNKEHAYGAVRDNQLRTLDHIGLFHAAKPGASAIAKRPDQYPHLVDPLDAKQDLDVRARSYLHANCASCH